MKYRDVEFKIVTGKYYEPFQKELNELLATGLWRIVETEISAPDHWYNAYLVRSEKIEG